MSDPETPAAPKPKKENGGSLVTKEALNAFMSAALGAVFAPDQVKAALVAGTKAMEGKLAAGGAAGGATPGGKRSAAKADKKPRPPRNLNLHNLLMAGAMHQTKAEEAAKPEAERVAAKEQMGLAAARVKGLSDAERQMLSDRYAPLLERLNARGADERHTAEGGTLLDEMARFEAERRLPPFSLRAAGGKPASPTKARAARRVRCSGRLLRPPPSATAAGAAATAAAAAARCSRRISPPPCLSPPV